MGYSSEVTAVVAYSITTTRCARRFFRGERFVGTFEFRNENFFGFDENGVVGLMFFILAKWISYARATLACVAVWAMRMDTGKKDVGRGQAGAAVSTDAPRDTRGSRMGALGCGTR